MTGYDRMHLTEECTLQKEDKAVEQNMYMISLEETVIKFCEDSIKKHAVDDEWIRKIYRKHGLKHKGKNDMKEPVPRDLPVDYPYARPTPILECLTGQKGNLYKTRETVCMIGIPKETHEEKTRINNGCNILVKDVERVRKILTPTIHTLANLKPVVQTYMPLSSFGDKASVTRGEEHDIPLQDGIMQPLTPQTTHITPPDDVAPATSPILDKHSSEFGEEYSDITRVAEMADGNPAKELSDIIKTYDFETFIRKLLHQESQSSHETGKIKRGMKSHLQYGSNLSLPYLVAKFTLSWCSLLLSL
ncbi:hypothetical protein Tco_1148008 [Tanacetum coccineum]